MDTRTSPRLTTAAPTGRPTMLRSSDLAAAYQVATAHRIADVATADDARGRATADAAAHLILTRRQDKRRCF